MTDSATRHSGLLARIAPGPVDLSELATFETGTDPRVLLGALARDFAPDMARIFPGHWAWAALAAPRAQRQVWFGILSGLVALPEDCRLLRRNLMMLDTGLMLRLRFGEVAGPVGDILARLGPHPLPRYQYDALPQMLAQLSGLATWFAEREGEIDTVWLRDALDAWLEDSGPV